MFAHDVQEMNQNRARVKLYQAEQYRKMGYAEHAEYLSNGAHTTLNGGNRGGSGSASSSIHSSPSQVPVSARTAHGGTAHPSQQYAHKLPQFKTQLCRNYLQYGQCKYGASCNFCAWRAGAEGKPA